MYLVNIDKTYVKMVLKRRRSHESGNCCILKGSSQSKLYIFRMQYVFADHHHHEQKLFYGRKISLLQDIHSLYAK